MSQALIPGEPLRACVMKSKSFRFDLVFVLSIIASNCQSGSSEVVKGSYDATVSAAVDQLKSLSCRDL